MSHRSCQRCSATKRKAPTRYRCLRRRQKRSSLETSAWTIISSRELKVSLLLTIQSCSFLLFLISNPFSVSIFYIECHELRKRLEKLQSVENTVTDVATELGWTIEPKDDGTVVINFDEGSDESTKDRLVIDLNQA